MSGDQAERTGGDRAEPDRAQAMGEGDGGRAAWLGLLARSDPQLLAALWDEPVAHEMLRAPALGTVMLRARIGGAGAAFNLGEMVVTRCVLRLDDGTVGFAQVQGRDGAHARRVALLDALMQGPRAAEIRNRVLDPLAARLAAVGVARAGRAARTRVDFTTLMRGED